MEQDDPLDRYRKDQDRFFQQFEQDLKDKSQASAEANLVARFRKVGVTQAEVNRLWKSFKDVASPAP